jgi:hypothetical protein
MPDHTVPYGTVLSGRFSRHFVPGYDHPVPPGQKPFAAQLSQRVFGPTGHENDAQHPIN